MSRSGPDGTRRLLLLAFRRLRGRYGHAGWWPGESPFEVCVGAILVQNTAWANVERTLERLRARSLLSFDALDRISPPRLARLLRSSGTFRVKARRLRAFLDFLGAEYGGRVEGMKAERTPALRRKLLAVPGVGPETADSIALYAAGKPLFVVGAYTRRVLSRLGLVRGERAGRARPASAGTPRSPRPPTRGPRGYDQVQRYLMDRLPLDAALYNDYHAQLVRLGKDHCRPRPRCAGCPLDDLCPKRGVVPSRGAPVEAGDGGSAVS